MMRISRALAILQGTMRDLRSIGTGALLALLAAGCEGALSFQTTQAPTYTLLTDTPFPYDRVARVDLYVVSVSGTLSPTGDTTNGTFVTLATPNRRINLLALQGGLTDQLGAVTLPKGAMTAVRMIIDTDSSSLTLADGRVLTGATTPGIKWQSSAGRPTLNAQIIDQILVPDTGAVIVIDYDVGRAFIPMQELDSTSTDSSFIFSPVLNAVDVLRTGTISGAVFANATSGPPVIHASLRLYLGNPANPENTWGVFATARTDSSGSFRFSCVAPNSYWTSKGGSFANLTYIITVDPPSGSSLTRVVVPNITVTAQSDTKAGSIALP